MISLLIYIVLIAVAVALAIYCFVDWENRLYGNIIAGVVVSILFFYLAITGLYGEVQHDVQLGQSQIDEGLVINESTGNTQSTINYTYLEVASPFQSSSMSWFCIMCGLIMSVVTALFSIQIFHTQVAEKGGR